MHQLVFATNNAHKLRELGEILKGEFTLLSLNDISCSDDIPETGDTLEANASQKSFYIWDRFRIDCFSDDTGLEVTALNNEPGCARPGTLVKVEIRTITFQNCFRKWKGKRTVPHVFDV